MNGAKSPAELRSWGRYPPCPQTLHACQWPSQLENLRQQVLQAHGSTLPYGNGRSYGDSCLAASNHLLALNRLDRFITVDWDTGVLQAEGGVTLADILAAAIPHGWFLPVTPGTQFATLGGAIANDVHGKNHHVRGTFGRHVRRFALSRSCDDMKVCSPTEHAPLFAATIGGLGLTGIITWAEIQLMPIASTLIETRTVRFANLDEFFALSETLDHQHEYSVAWIDCLASGKDAGRGAFYVGDHPHQGPLALLERPKLSVPFVPPVSLINKLSLRMFNEAYFRRTPVGSEPNRIHYEPFFYPLDRILHWNRIYGKNGFQQYQCVIPHHAGVDATRELLRQIAKSGQGSFLAVLKRCGDLPSPGLLSFPMPGVSLALDFPQTATLDAGLFRELDHIVQQAGGRLYPAKDAHMSGADFRRSYPAWEQVEALRDPALNSRFWSRVST